MPVTVGLDVLINNQFALLKNRRVGLLTNPSAVTSDLRSAYDVMAKADNVELAALFSPEHGFLSSVQDGEKVGDSIDPATGAPIYSLYGKTLKPTPEMLDSVDLVVIDIQDIGVRYYTYVYTVSYMLEACGENNVDILILDRPNPLGGVKICGPLLEPGFESFVGRFYTPVCHGMSLGEFSQLINGTWNPSSADVQVLRCEGWNREMEWGETGLSFVPPSPNMPKVETAWHYPGSCLVEGTELSEGRGTTLPLEIVGAPWIDGLSLATRINELNLPGVRFRPHSFQPTASKFAGETCHGVQAHIIDLNQYKPVETWLRLIELIHDLYPECFRWLPPVKEGGLYHFDRLIGSDEIRKRIDSGKSLDDLFPIWKQACDSFAETRKPFLIYG